jgi:tight adherence protein C
LTQALRIFSESFRQRRSDIAEERAHKLPVKLVFPMMLFIFPAIFVFAGAPAITQLVRALLSVNGG